jgi:hypothetical protein
MTTGYYAPMPRSPITELSAGIDAVDTDVPVVNAARLPAAPNVATIGPGEDDSETIKYTGKTGNTLTGCTRGFDPSGSAKAWDSGTAVSRVITTQDIEVLQDHAQAETGGEHGAVSAATASKIMARDADGRARVAAPSHDDDIARKQDVDAKPDLGETSADAYRGDRGKTAYDHSQAVTGAEHGAVSAATANMIVRRDSSGRARVAAPSDTTDIARKAEVDECLKLAGGTMTGKLYPQNNTDYTTGQSRRIILSTGDPSGGGNGDIWLKYEA